MRLLRALGLSLLLAGPAALALAPPASAETAATKKPRRAAPPYRVVKVLPETTQALLFDKRQGTHVLVDVGQQLPGFAVVEIEDDQVTLTRVSDGKDFVLVAPGAPAPAPAPAPVDPYGEPTAARGDGPPLLDPYPAGVLDPYGTEGVREVKAPDGQRADEQPPARKDEPPTKVAPPKPAPEPAPPKVAPAPVAPQDETISISRTELDAALGDFVKIGREVEMAVVTDGIELRRVAKESFFHRMGMRSGDLIKKVDGKVIKNLDDAAGVYARLGKARTFTIELVRGGATITLRYQITS